MTKVSEDLPPEAAALIGSVMANGFQWALRRGGVKMGDYVLIQGPGQQGLACTFAASHAGAARIFISGIGRDKPRLELAKRWGAHRTINVEEENVIDVIREETNGAMVDVVVDVSGNPKAIVASIDCLRRQGTMVLGGLTGDSTVTPLHMDKLVWGEITSLLGGIDHHLRGQSSRMTRWIGLRPLAVGNNPSILVCLNAISHRPHHISFIVDVDVAINDDD